MHHASDRSRRTCLQKSPHRTAPWLFVSCSRPPQGARGRGSAQGWGWAWGTTTGATRGRARPTRGLFGERGLGWGGGGGLGGGPCGHLSFCAAVVTPLSVAVQLCSQLGADSRFFALLGSANTKIVAYRRYAMYRLQRGVSTKKTCE
jgi:hypothetical protein